MAIRQRVPMEQIRRALQGAPQLRSFLLHDVTPTGKLLGGGSYGEVVGLQMSGLTCAGKKIYDTLIDPENQGAQVMVDKYYKECSLLSELRHPHIVQFLGICFLPDSQLPVLVMERLQGSLDELLETTPNIPLHTKLSILHDVATGLVFLHNRSPAVIHRDLTARNVLLNATMTAKIADLGNSRISTLRPGHLAQTMTKGIPGTLVYMPPEASTDHYGPPLDMFSFGHLSLFTAIQVFPGDLLPSTYTDPRKKKVKARTELERRENYIATLEGKLGKKYALVVFIKECLAYEPASRPTAEKALEKLDSMKKTQQDPYQGMNRLQLEKLLEGNSSASERVKELQSHIIQMKAEKSGLKDVCQAKKKMVHVMQLENSLLKQQMADKDSLLSTQESALSTKETEFVSLKAQFEAGLRRTRSLEEELKARISMLSVKDASIEALTEELKGKDKMLKAKKSEDGEAENLGITKAEDESESEWEINRRTIKIMLKLGAGQFSEVWKGLWNNTVHVAVKTLKPGTMPVSEYLAQAQIMKKLRHPKLLQLYALCTKEEPVYIITELMKHGTLLEYVRGEGRSLKLPSLVDIGAQVASGMAYFEEHGYIHTDLAARSIFVSDNIICKIGGFDHVYTLNNDDKDEYHPADGFKFPIKWTAIEAAHFNRFSIKSSVWSFGILLTELITYGRFPYAGMTNRDVLEQVLEGYRMPSPPGCPDELYRIMLDCWRKEPSERPTFETLEWKLEEFFTTDPQS